MDNLAQTFITLGLLFLLGLATDKLGERTPLPRVSLMILFGFIIGPGALNILPDITKMWFPVISDIALIMIGFLLGEKLTLSFFILAGSSLHIESFTQIGLMGGAYILFRIVGRFMGGWIGGTISQASPEIQKWMGMALMPQAGVALGMALIGCQKLPELHDIIFPVVISATVFFELIGPIMTRHAIIRSGDVVNINK